MTHEIKIGITICTPMPFVKKPNGRLGMQNLTVEWHRHRMSMGFPTNIQFYEVPADGMEVADARNYAAKRSLELGSEFLFFIDSDVLLAFDALQKLMRRAREFPDHDIFSGLYCTKNLAAAEPLIYKHDGQGPFWDWAIGDLVFDLASVGMGCALLRTDLFRRIEHTSENPWFFTKNTIVHKSDGLERNRGTEDIWFCRRAREDAGAKVMVDTSILCGHQDLESGVIFGLPIDSMPHKRARWLPDHKDEKEERKAIDLGAGHDPPRQWPDHRTYTLDIRPDIGVDYVQDLRCLNLPDDHFDLVASSHTLEHIGRWDQEKVWLEMFRICKPGGKLEVMVPNLQWAAGHIVDGHIDEDVMNVLYGAQEGHGYKRELNLHFFAYTPDIARWLAEMVGFTEIEIQTYKDRDELGFNLILTADKPAEPKDELEQRENLDGQEEEFTGNGDGRFTEVFGDGVVPKP